MPNPTISRAIRRNGRNWRNRGNGGRGKELRACVGDGGDGGGLSEGQAQRIAIARALLRKGNILLLDEATSALDAATEKQLLLNLQNKAQDKTLLFITHRPEVLSHCSQVLRLQRH